ncbi:MAG: hypothetical protein GY795_20390 [Desulfobacterales bacterium]|nr:hypothetical protein [Desulfobacterales bacterium]
MVFKITLDIRGKHLYPEKLLPELSGELVMTDSFKPAGTFVGKGKAECYGFGGMSMMHPKKICYAGDEVLSYENTVIQFLKKNYQTIAENGGADICVSYEIYFSGDTFNLGVFNEEQLKMISNCNASLSFTAYQMSEEKIVETFDDRAVP